MDIKGFGLDAAQRAAAATQKTTQENLSSNARFMDILAMMQSDGVIAQDTGVQGVRLTDEQRQTLRQTFDIDDMAPYANKRALLNELVGLGLITAQESELSMMQLLPPSLGAGAGVVQTGGAALAGGWDVSAGIEAMLDEPNYLSFLQKAIGYDGMFSRSQDVADARQKLYDVLGEIFV